MDPDGSVQAGDFYREIVKVLGRIDWVSGAFSETVRQADGGLLTHRFSFAVGTAWNAARDKYTRRFGVLPAWVLTCHPSQRIKLCAIARRAALPLPVDCPDQSLIDEVREAIPRVTAKQTQVRSSQISRGALSIAVRESVTRASLLEAARAPFNLFGRGHEPRVTLDRALARTLRGLEIPSIYLAGYGAKYRYPLRIFKHAEKLLARRLGASPIRLDDSNRKACLVRQDDGKHSAQR